MRFDERAQPIPEPKRRYYLEIARWLVWPLGAVLFAVVISVVPPLLTALVPPIPASSSASVQTERVRSETVEPTIPPVILEMAAAIATEYAPTPTPTPTPIDTYTPVPTPTLPNCAAGLPDGTLCEWPLPVITPMPEPICTTPEPGAECVWDTSSRPAATPARDDIGTQLR